MYFILQTIFIRPHFNEAFGGYCTPCCAGNHHGCVDDVIRFTRLGRIVNVVRGFFGLDTIDTAFKY